MLRVWITRARALVKACQARPCRQAPRSCPIGIKAFALQIAGHVAAAVPWHVERRSFNRAHQGPRLFDLGHQGIVT